MKNEFVSHLRENPIVRYALKHLSESGLAFHGQVFTDHYRDGKLLAHNDQGHNTFTTEGMAAMLNIMFGTTSKAGSAIFYVGIFKNNISPAVGDTAAAKLGAASTYGECQDADYSTPATNKPAYTIASTSTASCTNAASAASFTIATAASWMTGWRISTPPVSRSK